MNRKYNLGDRVAYVHKDLDAKELWKYTFELGTVDYVYEDDNCREGENFGFRVKLDDGEFLSGNNERFSTYITTAADVENYIRIKEMNSREFLRLYYYD